MPKFDKAPREPTNVFDNDQVSRLLLHNGYEVEVLQGSYKEMRPTGGGPEIFIAQDTATGHNVCGPTSNIMLIWFSDQSTG